MDKKLILVGAPPACGKNYVCRLICQELGQVAYFNKDDLAPLVRTAFAVAHEKMNMDGDFYSQSLRQSEYETLFSLAFSALKYSSLAVINAPFLKEVRDDELLLKIKEKANEQGAKLVFVWVTAPSEVVFERMKARNSDRDELKLENWAQYLKNTDYSVPNNLILNGAVDELFVFNNQNEATARKDLAQFMRLIKR